MVSEVGLAPILKSGPVTTSVAVVLWTVASLPVPVMVRVYVPAGVDSVVGTVSVDVAPELEGVTAVGLNAGVTPEGWPVAARLTLEV